MAAFGNLALVKAINATPRTGPGRMLTIELLWKALKKTRKCPFFGIFLTQANFKEQNTGSLARLNRIFTEYFSKKSILFYFNFRLWRWFRIDNRFFLEVELRPNELFSHTLSKRIPEELLPGHYEIWLGPDEAVPPFPKPIAPVFSRAFKKIGSVEIIR